MINGKERIIMSVLRVPINDWKVLGLHTIEIMLKGELIVLGESGTAYISGLTFNDPRLTTLYKNVRKVKDRQSLAELSKLFI